MNDDLDQKHREMETALSRRETSSPLEGDCSRCGPEHGIREGARGVEPSSRHTRPDRATRFDFWARPRRLRSRIPLFLLPARQAYYGKHTHSFPYTHEFRPTY